MPKILIVEDDPAMRDLLKHVLSREGMEMVAAKDGEEALRVLRSNGGEKPFDFVVLDLMLPGMDGASVCQEIRQGEAGSANRALPILMLTARNDETSVVVGLEVGADDYLTKPFKPSELVSRIRAHLRRRHMDAKRANEQQDKLEFPGLTLNLLKRQVLIEGKSVELTAREFEVLKLLACQPGRVYSREQIMRHLWNGEFFGEARAADVHVQHLRKKIEPNLKNPRYIQTVRGFGYKFAELTST